MRTNWTMLTDGGKEARRVAKALKRVHPEYRPFISETRTEDGDEVKFVNDYKIVTFKTDFDVETRGAEVGALIEFIKPHLKTGTILNSEYIRELEPGDKLIARVYAFLHSSDPTGRADFDFFIVERKEV